MKRGTLIASIIVVALGLALITYSLHARAVANSKPHTFNLSEFGIALTLPGSLTDLTYTAKESTPGPGTLLHMYIAKSCEIGTFYKIQKNAIATSGTPWTKETLEQFQVPIAKNPGRVKEFTDFYLIFEPSEEPCSSDKKAAQIETDKRYALWNALSTARFMGY